MTAMAEPYVFPFSECEALEIAAELLSAVGVDVDYDEVNLEENSIELCVVGGKFDRSTLVLRLKRSGNAEIDPTFDLVIENHFGKVPIEDDCPASVLHEALRDIQEDYGCQVRAY